MVDSHSKWIEAIPIQSFTTKITVDTVKVFFANFGLPEEIVSDNSLQFSSQDFELFHTNNGIKQMCTSPYHSASNGAVERAVQAVKQPMAKMVQDLPLRQHLTKFLLTYQTMPHTTTDLMSSFCVDV